MKIFRIGLGLFVVAAAINLLTPPPPRVDLGRWRAVVVHSDDWGLEGWFPRSISDSLRAVLSAGVPDWQRAYLQSTLETADDVRSMADLLSGFRDADGLPLVLQANTIVAGPSVEARPTGPGWPVHPSGEGPVYDRPGLADAVDDAIDRGVWWPELHGLTHYDLERYAQARAEGDPLALAAAREGVLAYDGYRHDHELGHPDATRALRIARESVERFRRRFGRAPTSVIAPDYRWTDEDERAWAAMGIAVVQAKREQIDPTIAPGTWRGRLRKWIGRKWFAVHGALRTVERTVDLEPYGSADPAAGQGAVAAAVAMERAFARGEPAVVSIHRVQLASTDPGIAAAGRAQLADLVDRLGAAGPVRFLVDAELRQLAERGWSVHRRGPRTVLRNWTDRPVRVVIPGEGPTVVPARTSALLRNSGDAREE